MATKGTRLVTQWAVIGMAFGLGYIVATRRERQRADAARAAAAASSQNTIRLMEAMRSSNHAESKSRVR